MRQACMEKEAFAREEWILREGLLRTANSIVKNLADAEDAVSQAVLIAWQKRGQLKDVSRLKPWLFTILVRTCYDMRRKGRRTVLCDDMSAYSLRMSQTGDDLELWLVLENLEEKYASLLTLYYYEGFKVDEMARILGISRGTICARLAKGREILKYQLTEMGDRL